MDDNQQGKTAGMSFFNDWIKSGTDFWASMLKAAPAAPEAPAESHGKKGARSRPMESLESAVRMWQSLASVMGEPAMADAALKGLSALPDIFLRAAQASWDVCFQIQKSGIEKAGKIGQKVEAYRFESLDQESFQALREIYEKEIRQYFYIPQLGLTRFYQERVGIFLDRLNLLEATLGEFMAMLNLPFEQTNKVMQQEMERLTREGKVPKEAKSLYNLWVKVLEGHFMTLFKSPEYNQTLADLFIKATDFIVAKNEVFQDILQILPVPTYKEVDELYRDLHALKKRVRELEGQLNPA
ncbi:MAG: Poly(R)-hydroxyalkanoic acid synthase subunit (PHA_synth_III_E) [Syntrophaceae bacterium PtaB.Bin095]|jgi:hypothetical protein|nr:MAG: Poly(R)-hydroxyalkanoic acid synthase subunit (PHA_synth_III_E) [Syntrophaceae bacterium PtaB.Bin095]